MASPHFQGTITYAHQGVDVDVPFGQDLVSYLYKVHKQATQWMVSMRKLGLFKVMQASDVTQESPEWQEFKSRVADTWGFPDLEEELSEVEEKTVFVDRCKQLLKKLPSHQDGKHAEWLHPAKKKTQGSAARGEEFNTMNACLKRHQGQVKVMDVKYLVEIDNASEAPQGATITNDNGRVFFDKTKKVCFTLAECFQYFRGTSSALYLWYCSNGEEVNKAKKKTQPLRCAAEFQQQKNSKAAAKCWLQHIDLQLKKEFREFFKKPLKEIPADIMKEIRDQVSTAITAALRDTSNRNIDLNVFMAKRPYQSPAAPHEQLHWAAMHDERLIISLCDPELPEEFLKDVRRVYEAEGWIEEADQAGVQDWRQFATVANLCGEMTYACSNCGVSAKALSGWNVKPSTGNRSWRWLDNNHPPPGIIGDS